MSKKYDSIDTLVRAGIGLHDAQSLRRISMTLQSWFERECGDSNAHAAWAIVRGRKESGQFVHDDDGSPFMEVHHYNHGRGPDRTTHSAIHDREKGARKRLSTIMARYPGWQAYVQGDPRGAALYILRPGDLVAMDGHVLDIKSNYTRGICVCK